MLMKSKMKRAVFGTNHARISGASPRNAWGENAWGHSTLSGICFLVARKKSRIGNLAGQVSLPVEYHVGLGTGKRFEKIGLLLKQRGERVLTRAHLQNVGNTDPVQFRPPGRFEPSFWRDQQRSPVKKRLSF